MKCLPKQRAVGRVFPSPEELVPLDSVYGTKSRIERKETELRAMEFHPRMCCWRSSVVSCPKTPRSCEERSWRTSVEASSRTDFVAQDVRGDVHAGTLALNVSCVI